MFTTAFWVNLGVFYVTWAICVVWQMPWAVATAAVAIALHLGWIRQGCGEWRVLAVCSAIGIAVDSLLTATGMFRFQFTEGAVFGATLAPLWLIALWLGFATTLNVSMQPLSGRVALAAVFGAIMGPFSYWAGFKLDAVSFPMGVTTTLIVLSAVWAVMLPALLHIANRLATR